MNTATYSNIVRINITVPKELITELEKAVPPRGKSGFISEAIEEKLRRENREKAFKEIDTMPPTFTNIKDSAAYVSDMRKKEDAIRTKRLAT